jgi:hypothetical protein
MRPPIVNNRALLSLSCRSPVSGGARRRHALGCSGWAQRPSYREVTGARRSRAAGKDGGATTPRRVRDRL